MRTRFRHPGHPPRHGIAPPATASIAGAARALLLGAALGLAAPMPAARAQAAAPARLSLRIAGGSLEDALNAFARQAGITLSFDPALVGGKRAAALSGSYTVEEGLAALLAAHGLAASRTGGGWTVHAVPGQSEAMLPQVTVRDAAAAESPNGPGNGYVARQSAAATKTGTPVLETAQSISVITRDQMDDQGVINVNQAFRYSAGAVTDFNGADTKGGTYLNMRGFPAETYLDGLRLVTGTFVPAAYDPYMLNRMELVKGPSSVLFGQISPGGFVNYVSKRPTEEPVHEVYTQFGNFGRIGAGFDFGGPLDADRRWLYRVTGVAFDSNTQVDQTKDNRFALAPSLTYRPDSATSLTLLADFRRDPNMGFWNKLPAQGTLLHNPAGQIPYSFYSGDLGFNKTASSQASIGYAFEHAFNDVLTVRQNLRYQHLSFAFDSVQGDSLSGTTMVRDKFMDDNWLNTFVVDNQAQAKFRTGALDHTMLVGLDYQSTVAHDTEADADAPTQDIFNPNYHAALRDYTAADFYIRNRQRIRQLGLYAQDQVKLGRWRLNLGLRQDWSSTATDDFIAQSATRQSDRAFTWQAGLLYLFDSGIAPYASYTTSFQPTLGTDAYGSPFVPTRGKQYEVGIKYQPQHIDALITASLFDLRQRNVVTQDPDNPNNRIQSGEVRSRGAELEARLNLSRELRVIASYTYTHAAVAASNDGDAGNRIFAIPLNAFALWAKYDFHRDALAGLGLGLGVRYTGSTYDQSNTLHVPPFTLFDAALTYDLGRLAPALHGVSVAVNAQNLFNRHYVQSCVNGCYYGLERTVVATARYRW
ncbi:TonB-dependent siderophore receptor [Cupriavidus sp. 30B13]|uniref:TonB-dependent siderophore receptor n=1 Tax=Cupriavidus sp. 30B13 TaxID=3384241 RepID=UPI003B91ABD8